MRLEKIQGVPIEWYKQFLLECQDDDAPTNRGPKEITDATIAEYIQRCIDSDQGVNLPSGRVPQTTYLLLRDERCIGIARMRHALTDELRELGGHVGYYVHPDFRRYGNGSSLLALVLQRLTKHGVGQALITCDEDNLGSIGVIEKNGGELTFQGVVDGYENPIRRYWIELS